MSTNFIPLPMATPGKDYVISYIEKGDTNKADLRGYGIYPGSKIKLLFNSPTKNPSAYEVMGAVLALREEDSKNIYISSLALSPQINQT